MPYGSGMGGVGYGGGVGMNTGLDAAAQGITSGLQLGMQLQNNQFNQQRTKTLDAQNQAQQQFEDQRQTDSDNRVNLTTGLKALDGEIASHQNTMAQTLSQYGNDPTKVPPDVMQAQIQHAQDLSNARRGIASQLYGPYVQQQRADATQTFNDLQSGATDIHQMNPDDITRTLAVATNRPPSDFLPGKDGSPPLVLQAGQQLSTAIDKGDQQGQLAAINTLLAPDIKHGIGAAGPNGGIVTDKQVTGVIPAPNGDPDSAHVILATTEKMPDGSTKVTQGPWTSDRDHQDDSPVHEISITDALQRAESQVHLAVQLNHDPALSQKVQTSVAGDGGKQADQYLQAYYAIGGATPGAIKRSVSYHDLGGKIIRDVANPDGTLYQRQDIDKSLTPEQQEDANAPADPTEGAPKGYMWNDPNNKGAGMSPIRGGPADPKSPNFKSTAHDPQVAAVNTAIKMYNADYPVITDPLSGQKTRNGPDGKPATMTMEQYVKAKTGYDLGQASQPKAGIAASSDDDDEEPSGAPDATTPEGAANPNARIPPQVQAQRDDQAAAQVAANTPPDVLAQRVAGLQKLAALPGDKGAIYKRELTLTQAALAKQQQSQQQPQAQPAPAAQPAQAAPAAGIGALPGTTGPQAGVGGFTNGDIDPRAFAGKPAGSYVNPKLGVQVTWDGSRVVQVKPLQQNDSSGRPIQTASTIGSRG